MSLTNGMIITSVFHNYSITPTADLRTTVTEDIFPQYSPGESSLYIPAGKVAVVNVNINIEHFKTQVGDSFGVCQLYVVDSGAPLVKNFHTVLYSPSLIGIEEDPYLEATAKGQSITVNKKILLNENEKLKVQWKADAGHPFVGYIGVRCAGYITPKTQ
jgi:hypothetical protein